MKYFSKKSVCLTDFISLYSLFRITLKDGKKKKEKE